MPAATLNRRQFERFSVAPMYTEVKVQRIDDGRMSELSGYAYDLSEGGLRIELEDRLDIGEHVNVSLRLPGEAENDPQIHLACEMVWINDEDDDPVMPRMALRVLRYLSDDSRRRLIGYLSRGAAGRAA
ncbi:MAG: PilZ domain-containing protein [Phycisphaerales bacterium]